MVFCRWKLVVFHDIAAVEIQNLVIYIVILPSLRFQLEIHFKKFLYVIYFQPHQLQPSGQV